MVAPINFALHLIHEFVTLKALFVRENEVTISAGDAVARCAARTAVSEEEGLSAATDALCERIGAKVRNISATGAQFPRAAVESLGRDLDALADRAQKEQSFVKRARRVSVAVA